LAELGITVETMNPEEYSNLQDRISMTLDGKVNGSRYFRGIFDKEANLWQIASLQVNKKLNRDDPDLYNYVNDELKALYVAITRAKKNFIVYDDGLLAKNRANIDTIWRQLDVVEEIKATNLEPYRGLFAKSADVEAKIWTEQGFNYLRKEQFIHAEKCFQNLKMDKPIYLCRAFTKLGEIQKKEFFLSKNFTNKPDQIKKIQKIFYYKKVVSNGRMKYIRIEDNIDLGSKLNNDLNLKKVELNIENKMTNLSKMLHNDYLEAAEMFNSAGKYSDAGLCYFNAEAFDQAREHFLKGQDWSKVAQIYFLNKDYE
jgi:hypothetical protein